MVKKIKVELSVIYEYDDTDQKMQALKTLYPDYDETAVLSALGEIKNNDPHVKIDTIRTKDGLTIYQNS